MNKEDIKMAAFDAGVRLLNAMCRREGQLEFMEGREPKVLIGGDRAAILFYLRPEYSRDKVERLLRAHFPLSWRDAEIMAIGFKDGDFGCPYTALVLFTTSTNKEHWAWAKQTMVDHKPDASICYLIPHHIASPEIPFCDRERRTVPDVDTLLEANFSKDAL